jgi:multiple sugar transport system substrate-binding protein
MEGNAEVRPFSRRRLLADVRTFSRRSFLAGGLLAAAGTALAACSPAAPSASSGAASATAAPTTAAAAAAGGSTPGTSGVTISYWNDYGGANGAAMDDLLAQFQKESGIKVEQQRMVATDINSKIRVANQGGQNPDLVMLNSFAIPGNAQAGILEEMDENTLAGHGFKAADFAPNAWATPVYQGKRYGLPLDAVMYMVFLNDKVFQDAGLAGSDGKPKPPTNRDELMSAAKSLTKGDVYGFSLGAGGDINPFEQLLWQNNANVFSDDFSKPAIADPGAVEVATWYGSLLNTEKIVPPIGVDELKAFTAGKIGIWIGGSWNVSGFAQSNTAFTPAQMPQIFKKPIAWADTHNYTFPVQAKPDDAKRAAAWTMIKWFQDNVVTWTLNGGVLGASLKAQTDPKVTANPSLQVMAAQAPIWGFAQPTPKWADWEVKAPPVVQAIYGGTSDPTDALKQLSDSLS